MRGKRAAQTSGWKGGRYTRRDGYVYVYAPDHPDAVADGYVLEHRLVAEQTIGRRLNRGEHVHHINGVKGDNRPENLVVLTHSEHIKAHAVFPKMRATLDPEVLRARSSAAGKKGAAKRWHKQDE